MSKTQNLPDIIRSITLFKVAMSVDWVAFKAQIELCRLGSSSLYNVVMNEIVCPLEINPAKKQLKNMPSDCRLVASAVDLKTASILAMTTDIEFMNRGWDPVRVDEASSKYGLLSVADHVECDEILVGKWWESAIHKLRNIMAPSI